jgi:hypothetical protein
MVSKMPGNEVCDEFEWLVTNGMSVVMACEQLGRSVPTMARLLWRYGRPDYIAELERARRFERMLAREQVQR